MRVLAAYLPDLESALAAPGGDALFEAIAVGAYAFGPTVDMPRRPSAGPRTGKPAADAAAFDPVILLDITGCSGLFGTPGAHGESVLAHQVVAFFASLQLTAHVAIAEGPRLAAMFAKLAHQPLLIAKADTTAALAAVPLSVMPLRSSEILYFVKLGLSKASDLMALPTASLAQRLERRDPRASVASRTASSAEDLMLLLRGEDRAPLCAYVRRVPPHASFDLPHATASSEALAFVFKSLCDTLWQEMPGLAVRKCTVSLRIDVGASRFDRDLEFSSTFAPALSRREDVLAALRSKLEQQSFLHDETCSVMRVGVRFDETIPSVLAALSLYSSEARAARALPKLLAELREGLGEERVGQLSVLDSWEMPARSALTPYGAATNTAEDDAFLLNVLEPTRSAEPAALGECEPLRLIVRLERDDWFSRGSARREILSAWADDRAVCALRSVSGTSLLGFFD